MRTDLGGCLSSRWMGLKYLPFSRSTGNSQVWISWRPHRTGLVCNQLPPRCAVKIPSKWAATSPPQQPGAQPSLSLQGHAPRDSPSSRGTMPRFLGGVPSSHGDHELGSHSPCTCLPNFLVSPSCVPFLLLGTTSPPSPRLRLCTRGSQTRTDGKCQAGTRPPGAFWSRHEPG